MRDIYRDAASNNRTMGPHASSPQTRLYSAAACLGVVFAIVPGLLQVVADPLSAAPPMPPQRPAVLSPSAPAPQTGKVAPPQPVKPSEGALAIQPSVTSPDEPIRPGVYNEGPGSLLRLPPASHARMHQCAIAWQNMKATGAAVEKTWFNFALECLAK